MASNYVEDEGRFHSHSRGSTPTGAAASPKMMRRSWSSSASASSGGGGGHGAAPKCVCAPATHAGSFKCRLHRTSSHGHDHVSSSPPSPAAVAAPPRALPSSSSRTVAAQ